MQSKLTVELGFVQRRLPWLVAAVALVVYLITLNHSSTFAGISSLSKAAGWDWRSNVVAPLHVILTCPVRWLPAAIQLPALNLLAAFSGALALGLLTQSVALLPHDRTREQRALEHSDHSMLSVSAAWLPPILAAMVCGLQLTFWEDAVVATGEAFDLLLFAWLINCLLRYRLDQDDTRLSRFALVLGLAMVNNYAMIALAPALVIAIVWIKGASFFNVRFLARLGVWGLAGLSLYVVLPLIASSSAAGGFGFWELMRSYWGFQKSSILSTPRYIVLLCSFTSLVPALFMGIRWPAQFGEASAAGNALTNLMTHVIHGVFLVACLYVAFDPPFSPRSLTYGSLDMLPLYYLGALAIGYCSGYLLLVFGAKPGPNPWQKPSPVRRLANVAIVNLLRAALVAIPAGLMVQNLPTVWANTGLAMSRLSRLVAQSLPPAGAVVLSDDPFRLYALKCELLKTQPGHKHVLVDTSQMTASGYHRFMRRRHPDRWPELQYPADPKTPVDQYTLINVLGFLAAKSPVYYLHPSFGYYFEAFYTVPHGPIFEFKPYTDPNAVSPPPLPPAEIQDAEKFWQSLKPTELDPLIRKAPPFSRNRGTRVEPRTLERYLAEIYSRSLNDIGVRIQRAGDFARGAGFFDLALRLNPANPSAFINFEYNRAWQDSKTENVELSQPAQQRLEGFGGRWDRILTQNGAVDHPAACLFLARSFQDGQNFRQAAQNLERTTFFDPGNGAAQITFMMMCVKSSLPDLALKKLAAFRATHPESSLKQEELMDLLAVEAWANVVRNDLPAAERLLTDAEDKYPKSSSPWETHTDIYLKLELMTNAMAVLERQLQIQPDHVRALVNYAAMKIRLGRAQEAFAYLEKALRINPRDEAAMMNRAIAHLALDQLDAAAQDLEAMRSNVRPNYKLQVLYQLGEVYWRKKNRKEALRAYEEFIKEAPSFGPEVPMVRQRIHVLETDGAF